MANQSKLDVIVSINDQFSKGFDEFNNKLKEQEQGFKDMAAVGALGLATIAGVSAKAIAAFSNQEKAEARLTQLTKQTTQASDEQIQSLKDQADALENVGVVGGDVVIFGQSQLATFALQTDTIKQLTPSMLDLAVATKGVNTTQEDMINIGNLVGKVMAGQTGALSKAGVAFSDAQEKILKTGNEMQRAKVLSEVLAQNFGGLNESTRKTTEGGFVAMGNAVDDVWKAIGQSLIPVMNQLSAIILPIVTSISGWVEKNQTLVPIILEVTAGISGLLLVLGTLGIVIPAITAGATAMGAAFTIITGPVGLVVLGIGLLIAAGYAIVQNWDVIKATAETVWTAIGTFFTNTFATLTAAFTSIGNTITTVMTGVFDFLKGVWDKIAQVFTFAFALIVGSVKAGLALMGINITDVWNGIVTFFTATWETIKNIFNGTVDAIKTGIQIFLQGAQSVWNTTWTAISGFFKTIWDGLRAIVQPVLDWITGAINTASEPVKGAFSGMWTGVSGVITGALGGIKGIIAGAINWMIDRINDAIGALNKLAAGANIIPGFKAPQIPKVPNVALAEGGIVTKPTTALIGEGGEPEAVIPLSKLGKIGGGGVNIYISGNSFTDKRSFEQMIDDVIMNKLRKNLIPS